VRVLSARRRYEADRQSGCGSSGERKSPATQGTHGPPALALQPTRGPSPAALYDLRKSASAGCCLRKDGLCRPTDLGLADLNPPQLDVKSSVFWVPEKKCRNWHTNTAGVQKYRTRLARTDFPVSFDRCRSYCRPGRGDAWQFCETSWCGTYLAFLRLGFGTSKIPRLGVVANRPKPRDR
jgi:hypothetical protein